MIRQFLLLTTLLATTALQAELPVAGVDPLKLEGYFDSGSIKTDLYKASSLCRNSYYACGSTSVFLNENEAGVTDDGRIASLWIGRWFYEPWSKPLVLRIWAEVVYVEFWTGTAPFDDYSGSSMAIQGINWWNFVDEVLEGVANNSKGKFTLSAPGWYGVHMYDLDPNRLTTAAPANITLTANVRKVPGGTEGEVDLTYSIESK